MCATTFCVRPRLERKKIHGIVIRVRQTLILGRFGVALLELVIKLLKETWDLSSNGNKVMCT